MVGASSKERIRDKPSLTLHKSKSILKRSERSHYWHLKGDPVSVTKALAMVLADNVFWQSDRPTEAIADVMATDARLVAADIG